jgi:hypothetical protein
MAFVIHDTERLFDLLSEIRSLDKLITELVDNDDIDSAVEYMGERNEAYLYLYEFIEEEAEKR